MLSSIALGLALATSGPAFGLSASPAAIHHAEAHHAYVITVKNTGTRPLTVRANLSQATEQDGECAVALDRSVAPSWAVLAAPASFRIGPGKEVRVKVQVRRPPPGHTELIASFIASRGKAGSVSASAGVGTALRFARPGTAPDPPCRAVASAPVGSGPDWWSIGLPGAAAVALLAIAWRLRRRRTV